MNNTILLTGGAGYIGSHTAVELIDAGYNVIIADDLSNSSEDVIDRIAQITGHRPDFVKCDCADKEAMDRIFTAHEIDAVIHFAGFKAVGESVEKPLKYYRNNIDTALTVLELMEKHGVKRFVFSSSATVYGTGSVPPLTENAPTGDCTNPYGQTKFMIEQILCDTANADPELSVVLLRYFNPIGAHESGLIGEKPNGIPNNLMPYITQVAAGIREKLSVFGNDYPTHDGTGVRDYIHVTDLAKGHVAALKYANSHTGAESFNLGTGTGYSVLDIVKAFETANSLTIPYVIAPRRSGDAASCFADPSKAKALLGWQAEKTLEDMCRDSWIWQKSISESR
ncbi:MAG: UDP-glucose 4-epimerase GalE [Oscillospiraceae bacterium]|nr:UDP-glucose 4-epimerase GalE [Oscillospiraceae bacterium]